MTVHPHLPPPPSGAEPQPAPASQPASHSAAPNSQTHSGDSARRRELAVFLRSRRERLAPERVGLTRGPRRRTPGLRREEVAHLSAVGVTWYTWLEQGRDIRVSVQVLDALARALLLDRVERSHLFALAGVPDPEPDAECRTVSNAARRLLRQLEPYPASVQNARYDVLASNKPYADVFGDPEELPPQERNCLWLLLTSPRWKSTFLDRDEMLRALIAKFRAAMAEHVADPVWESWLRRLQEASAEFRELWQEYEVAHMAPHVKRYQLPGVGLLRLEHRNMWLNPQPNAARLVAYVPADDDTGQRLASMREASG